MVCGVRYLPNGIQFSSSTSSMVCAFFIELNQFLLNWSSKLLCIWFAKCMWMLIMYAQNDCLNVIYWVFFSLKWLTPLLVLTWCCTKGAAIHCLIFFLLWFSDFFQLVYNANKGNVIKMCFHSPIRFLAHKLNLIQFQLKVRNYSAIFVKCLTSNNINYANAKIATTFRKQTFVP